MEIEEKQGIKTVTLKSSSFFLEKEKNDNKRDYKTACWSRSNYR